MGRTVGRSWLRIAVQWVTVDWVGFVSSERVGIVVAGRFRLDALVGVGGMGEVYRATHIDLAVPVAIKLLKAATAGQEKATARFRREARAAARLKSAHIVQVYDFGVDGDVPFIVMELVEGESLGQRLERVGRVSVLEASRILDQAAQGLEVAHRQGIIHRDIKPSNIFLAHTAQGEVLKLLDFGVAKPCDEFVSVTSSNEVVGSPLHMSPEQAQGEMLDPRSDIWALATVAFRMVTGADAFAGPTASSVLVKICSGRAPRASAVLRELTPEMDAFFEKAFAREISSRFQSAAELARAFALIARAPRPFVPANSEEFFRADATISLEPLSRTPAPERRPRSPWIGLGAAAALLVALAWFMNRGAAERLLGRPAASSPGVLASTPTTQPSNRPPPEPAAPESSASVAPPVSAVSGRPRRPPVIKASAKPFSAPPMPSSAARKRGDLVFGL